MARTKVSPKKNNNGEKENHDEDEAKCPCDQWIDDAVWIGCDDCGGWLHTQCVGLKGLEEPMVNAIDHYSCPKCFVLPSWVAPSISLTIKEDVTSVIKDCMNEKSLIEGIATQVTEKMKEMNVEGLVQDANAMIQKSWSQVAVDNQKKLITDVVTATSDKALAESMQKIDANVMEQRKRDRNIVVTGLDEGLDESFETIREKVFKVLDGCVSKNDIMVAKRVGRIDPQKMKRPIFCVKLFNSIRLNFITLE